MRALILAPFSEDELARLRTRVECVYESWLETRRIHDPEELGARLSRDGFDVVVCEADFVFEEVFDAAPNLRLVGICRNALNQVDIEAATRHGVAVTHARGRNTNAVAEMTLALMLALTRRIVPAHTLVSGAGWRDPIVGYRQLRGREIAGSTAGVIGFGQIGRRVTEMLSTLGAKVIVQDPLVADEVIRQAGATPASIDALLRQSDFVTLHVPENETTAHMVDARFLAAMQRHAFLINTSAGSVVDAAALAEALDSGTIAGAALDVFEGQPLPLSSPLLSCPNLILTPHIAGATAETIERHSRIMVDEILRVLDGEPLQYVVNVEYEWARRG